MNEILQLKGSFQPRPNSSRPGYPNIPKGSNPVSSDHIKKLVENLQTLIQYWQRQTLLKGALVDVEYTDVIAKSNRIRTFLASGSKQANDSVVGARFSEGKTKKHVITHYVNYHLINKTIAKMESSIALIDQVFLGKIGHAGIKSIIDGKTIIDFGRQGIAKSVFFQVIVDAYYVEAFDIPDNHEEVGSQAIITLYQTDGDARVILREIGIIVEPRRSMDQTTFLLYPDEISRLIATAPYLIAMTTEDKSESSEDEVGDITHADFAAIDRPGNEPVIGVIDTMFDKRVYFAEWVDFRKMVDDEISLDPDDFVHGTSVTSIIVDGHTINPQLDDGCGRFRVRHFGVAVQGEYHAYSIMQSIKEIVTANRDIKVWNLSLGSDREINPNFISPEAAILDKLQREHDVIFIVAGTNKKHDIEGSRMIGSPADSINSIVVNSVTSSGKPASYSRQGMVLSFFNKPDVSSYGGDVIEDDRIRVCAPTGESFCTGTSFAAPWVTRKMAYLIEILGLSREVAKALIVDAATGWTDIGNDFKLAPLIGHGPVPQHIEQVIESSDEEIKFVIDGISATWDTYTYNLPIPTHQGKYPFIAKATLCYFPECSISQGVDYTNTELDIYLGRINKNNIKPINKNVQSINDGQKHYLYEDQARELYRKWDNTKHIRERYTPNPRPKKVYDNAMWGISIKRKERLGTRGMDGVKFGLVVTLKEMHGINRIHDFIRLCGLRGWLVNRIDVDASIEIYNKSQEDIKFDT